MANRSWRCGQLHRDAEQLQRTNSGMLDLRDHLARRKLAVGKHGVEVADRSARHARCRQAGDPLASRAAAQMCVEPWFQLGVAGHARRVRVEAPAVLEAADAAETAP